MHDLSGVLQAILLLHSMLLLGAALAIVPKTSRSLSKATLQIHEAGEPGEAGEAGELPQLGICMIITGRANHLNSRHWEGRPQRHTQDRRDKWGGGNFLIFIKSVAFSSK